MNQWFFAYRLSDVDSECNPANDLQFVRHMKQTVLMSKRDSMLAELPQVRNPYACQMIASVERILTAHEVTLQSLLYAASIAKKAQKLDLEQPF
jgi:hypothetical protein